MRCIRSFENLVLEKGDLDRRLKEAERRLEEIQRDGADILALRSVLEDTKSSLKELSETNQKLKKELEERNRKVKIYDNLAKLLPEIIKTEVEDILGETQKIGKHRGDSGDLSVSVSRGRIELAHEVKKIDTNTGKTRSQIAYLYAMGELTGTFSVSAVNKLPQRHGWNMSPRTKEYLTDVLRS